MMKERIVMIMMNEIQNSFKELIDAQDKFFEKEEKELGCLTAEEHTNFIRIRNYIDDVFMRVINAKQPKKQNIETATTLPVIIANDDEGGVDICFLKRSQHEFEM